MLRADVEHLGQHIMFALGEGKVPGGLDGDPVDSVLAPVGPVFMCSWPLYKAAIAQQWEASLRRVRRAERLLVGVGGRFNIDVGRL